MKEWYKKLNIYYKTVTLSLIIAVPILLTCIFLMFIGWNELWLGFLLGWLTGVVCFTITGILETKFNNIAKTPIFIAVNIIRILVIGGILFMSGYFYYKMDLRLFNIFAVMVGYLTVLVSLIIMAIKNKEA